LKQEIIHVVNLQSYGGIQKLVLELTSCLNNRGIVQNDVLATRKVDLLKKTLPNNVNIIDVDNNNVFSRMKRIYEIFQSYHIIHFHGPYTLFQLVALFSGKQIVYTEHGTLQKANIKGTFKHFIQKRIFGRFYLEKFASTIIFISNWIQKDLSLKNKSQVVVYNGLTYYQPQLIQEDAFVLTIAARLIPKKRVHLAIDLMHKLRRYPTIKLQVIGDGIELESLKALAGDLFNKTVFFLGYKKDAYNVIASSDIYLMTTDMEPFGLVVLESMMSETLVLALNDSGGPTEILQENFQELIVDNVDGLAESVLYWKNHPKDKKETEAALNMLYQNNYTLNVMAENYLKEYLKFDSQ